MGTLAEFKRKADPSQDSIPEGDDEFEAKLLRRVTNCIKLSDLEEDMRRASDARGSNVYLNRHYAAPMPRNRAATVNNQARAIVDHKIALMTKQDPIPVVEPDDYGDEEASRIMRGALMEYWVNDEMMLKTRDALRLCNTTRTVASKTFWDPELNGGAGDITTDIIPGYRLILDPRTKYVEKMEFAGDRAHMSRSRAMLLYPKAASKFVEDGSPVNNPSAFPGGKADSPIQGPFKGNASVQYSAASGAIVNGKPTITAFTGRSPVGASDEAQIQLVELFHRDRTQVKKEVPAKDALGNPIKKIRMDGDKPLFEQIDEWDDILGDYGYTLAFDEVMETQLVPKYPYWRKTVILVEGGQLIDDCAWDAPLPYELLGDNPALEGPWDTGCILNVEHKQAAINVGESTMLDNLRFGSMRAFKTGDAELAQRNNLVLSPGDVVLVKQGTTLDAIEFPTVQDAWFKWKDSQVSDMERIIGVTGIMQGEAAGRVDSSSAYDTLAQTSGARVVECTQRMERWISRLMAKVGWYAQRYYTERHAVRVEDVQGNLTWERAASTQLMGSFSYRIEVGSTMAWNEEARNARLKDDLALGIIDKVAYWQMTRTPFWREIQRRQIAQNVPIDSPPPRTRQNIPMHRMPNPPTPH